MGAMTVPPVARPPRTGAQTADLVVTIVLLAVLGLFVWMVSFFVALGGMAAANCTSETCDFALLNGAVYGGMIAPWMLGIAIAVWAVIRLVRRRWAWWVPVLGGVLASVCVLIAVGLISAATGG